MGLGPVLLPFWWEEAAAPVPLRIPAITERKPLSVERVRVNWNHPLNNGLLYCWLMNRPSGGYDFDLSQQFPGAINASAPALWQPTGLLCDGDYKWFSTFPLNKLPSSGSIVMRYRRTTTAPDYYYVCTAASYQDFSIYIAPSSLTSGYFYINGSQQSVSWDGNLLFDGNWHTLVASWDDPSNVRSLNVDAGAYAYSDSAAFTMPTASTPLYFGARQDNTTRYVGGILGHISVYNRVLDSQSISALHNNLYGTPGNPRFISTPDVWFPLIGAEGGLVSGSTCWGQITGVTQDNTRTFTDNWTGTGTIESSGDGEKVGLGEGEYMESEVVNTGTTDNPWYVAQNVYAAGDTSTLKYRTGATEAACLVAEWTDYVSPFTSLGYVQVRIEG